MATEWQKYYLDDIAISIQPGPFGTQLHSSDYSDSGTPVVMPTNMQNGKINSTKLVFVNDEHVQRLSRHQVKEEDILFARKGDVKKAVYITKKEAGWLTGSDCLKVELNKDLCYPKFIFYFMQSPLSGRWLEKNSIGATMPSVNSKILGDIEIRLPKKEIQRKIASILSVYDDLIENNNKQIKLLEEAAQKLYKEWFVKLNFPGHENVKIVDGLPEGWSYKSILSCDFFKQTNPSVQEFEGIKKYYATADVNGTNLVNDGENITFKNRPSRASVQPCSNSVWFARMCNSYKILTCFGVSSTLAKDAIISSGFAGFTCEEKYYGFIHTLIASDFFDGEKNRYATGATQVSLTNEGLRRINILLPKEELIIRFSKYSNELIKECELLKKQNKELQVSKDKLLPKLMNQEIEVTA